MKIHVVIQIWFSLYVCFRFTQIDQTYLITCKQKYLCSTRYNTSSHSLISRHKHIISNNCQTKRNSKHPNKISYNQSLLKVLNEMYHATKLSWQDSNLIKHAFLQRNTASQQNHICLHTFVNMEVHESSFPADTRYLFRSY